MKDHDRYESLAGAIALGEATSLERETFCAHAAGCALCSQDLSDDAFAPLGAIVSARDDETWRPALDRAVLARIHERRARYSRFTVGALGWAAALSIAVNVAFVTGLASHVVGAFRPTTEAPQVATFPIRLPARTFAQLPRVTRPQGMALSPIASPRSVSKHPAAAAFSAGLAKAPIPPSPDSPLAGSDISDLLDARDARGRRNVAAEISLPCDDGRTSSCGIAAKNARP